MTGSLDLEGIKELSRTYQNTGLEWMTLKNTEVDALVAEIERLREENERLQKNATVQREIGMFTHPPDDGRGMRNGRER